MSSDAIIRPGRARKWADWRKERCTYRYSIVAARYQSHGQWPPCHASAAAVRTFIVRLSGRHEQVRISSWVFFLYDRYFSRTFGIFVEISEFFCISYAEVTPVGTDKTLVSAEKRSASARDNPPAPPTDIRVVRRRPAGKARVGYGAGRARACMGIRVGPS